MGKAMYTEEIGPARTQHEPRSASRREEARVRPAPHYFPQFELTP